MTVLKHARSAVLLLVVLPAMLSAQRKQDEAPLQNWATPLYWQPNQTEREAAGKAAPQLISVNAISGALTFVAITPCRLVDTRGAAAGFNGIAPFSGPSIPPAGTITIPVQSASEAAANTEPAPCGVIPAIALAYSFNLTVVPKVLGKAVDYVSLWPSGYVQPFVSTLNDPQGAVVANAAIVAAGDPTGDGGVSVYNAGPATTDVVIDMNGYFVAPDANQNTAFGEEAMPNATGYANTAYGSNALNSDGSGSSNTASGGSAMADNTTGSYNTATGYVALEFNTIGEGNTATGYSAMENGDGGSYNTASGVAALYTNTGSYNTGSGFKALVSNTSGNRNIAIGSLAASNVTGSNSDNIHIESSGASGDSGTVRIGTPGTQTSFFVAGVTGATTGLSGAVPVVIDSNGQLGTVSSSRRYKEDIQDMGDASSGLMRLRPVTFRYKHAYEDGSKPIDYGLIAEEVDAVYPDLVAHSSDGQIETVQYQKLNAMLLNEVQKQHRQLEDQREEMSDLKASLSELRNLLEKLTLTPALDPAR